MTVKNDALKSGMVEQKTGGWVFTFFFDFWVFNKHASVK